MKNIILLTIGIIISISSLLWMFININITTIQVLIGFFIMLIAIIKLEKE
jgi:hypothetical protein